MERQVKADQKGPVLLVELVADASVARPGDAVILNFGRELSTFELGAVRSAIEKIAKERDLKFLVFTCDVQIAIARNGENGI
jgi:hypothetical protein